MIKSATVQTEIFDGFQVGLALFKALSLLVPGWNLRDVSERSQRD
jgi:hypothetical protein